MIRWIRLFTRWLTRILLRAGVLPASTRADTDTMGEWKRLQSEKDDPLPGLVLPDPNAPHADLIRRVRLYAQNGAKALAPLLDKAWPEEDGWIADGVLEQRIEECFQLGAGDAEAAPLFDRLATRTPDMAKALHAAYNAPWTVVNGEVYEYESEKRKRVVQ
jgi:hypothetical protein